MRSTARIVLIGMATVGLLAGTIAVWQRPFQRLAQPSVNRNVQIVNSSQGDIFVVVVRPDTRIVIPPVSVPAHLQKAMHIFSGESTSEYDRTEFIFVAWSADRASRSLVLTGLELDARNGRIEFSDIDQGSLR